MDAITQINYLDMKKPKVGQNSDIILAPNELLTVLLKSIKRDKIEVQETVSDLGRYDTVTSYNRNQ
jgi:hypothetical protein